MEDSASASSSSSPYSCMLAPQRPSFKRKAQPSLLQRLQSREMSQGKPNTSSLNNRKFYQNITPNHAAHNVETPSCHIKKFTSDGEYLLCFTKNLQGIQLYHFKGDGRVDSSAPSPTSQKFSTYFSLVYEKFLASGNEVLCRDFFLQTSCGKFFIFASSGPSTTPPSSPLMSPASPALLPPSLQQENLLSDSFSTIPSPSFSLSASTDAFPPVAMSNLEDITFYLVGLKDGKVYDKRVFKSDFIHLPHHSGVYLYNDLFSVLSVHTQSIYLFQILGDKFVEARSIGHQCYEDDDLELACQREQEQKYNAQACELKGKSAPSIAEPEIHTLIPPLSASASRYLCHKEAKGSNSIPIQSSIEQEKETVISAGPIVGIKQRLLAHLFKQASESPNPARSLGLFYQQFTQYSSLVMWRMQLLDNSHLLIKFGSVDGVVKGHQGDSSSQQIAFFVVYNMYSTEILAMYENSSREFAQTFEQFCEYFRACTNSEGPLKYRSTCSNNVFVREHLLKQKMAVIANSRNGGEVQAVKRILSSLPFSPQSWSESPYFDKSLFNYDEKLISATERPKPCAEFPIKFYSRVDSQVQFRLSPGIPDKADRSNRKFASYVFHPSSPFVISIQHSLFQAPIVNFHFRA